MNDAHLSQIINFPTRFRQGQIPSLLDLVLLHDELLVNSLDSLPGLGKSDHLIISITLQISTELKSNSTAKYDFSKADFVLINSIIDSIKWNDEFNNLTCDEAVEVLQCFLLTICENFVLKKKPPKSTPFHSPWMTRSIKTLINKKKAHVGQIQGPSFGC